jgi:hypothetical protein
MSDYDELELERITRALKTRINDDLPTHLSTVQTRWANIDPVTLPKPVTVFLGHNPNVLDLESTDFPYVAAMAVDRTPRDDDSVSRWGYQEEEVLALLDAFVVAEDEATVNKRAWRYAEALVLMLRDQRSIEGYDQKDYKPEVGISEASRHPKTKEADMFTPGDVDYIQGVRITVRLTGG